MGVKLTDMRSKTKTTTIQWDGEEVEFCYFPNHLTPELEEAMESDDSDFVAEMMAPSIDWWDVLDDDGTRIPTDAATMKKVPSAFLMAMWRKITEEQNPPEGSS